VNPLTDSINSILFLHYMLLFDRKFVLFVINYSVFLAYEMWYLVIIIQIYAT